MKGWLTLRITFSKIPHGPIKCKSPLVSYDCLIFILLRHLRLEVSSSASFTHPAHAPSSRTRVGHLRCWEISRNERRIASSRQVVVRKAWSTWKSLSYDRKGCVALYIYLLYTSIALYTPLWFSSLIAFDGLFSLSHCRFHWFHLPRI